MTPRTLKTALGDRTVTARTGGEQPLRHHVMVIETLDGEDKPLYSNLDDNEADLVGRLAHFAQQARTFGIELSPAMRAKLQAHAELNLSNARSTCDAAGIDTRA